MNLNEHIQLWNQASIKLLDIRHAVLELGEELRSYQLPASAFLLPRGDRGGLCLMEWSIMPSIVIFAMQAKGRFGRCREQQCVAVA